LKHQLDEAKKTYQRVDESHAGALAKQVDTRS
jgi:hypothetical protein